jgi:hemerythrin
MLIDPKEIQKVANMFFNAAHEDIAESVNKLYDALPTEDESLIGKLMDEMIFDIVDHFEMEEEMMKDAEFFGYPMHKAEHDQMRKELETLREDWKREHSREKVKFFLEEKLVPWLKLHVAQWDSITATHIGD